MGRCCHHPVHHHLTPSQAPDNEVIVFHNLLRSMEIFVTATASPSRCHPCLSQPPILQLFAHLVRPGGACANLGTGRDPISEAIGLSGRGDVLIPFS